MKKLKKVIEILFIIVIVLVLTWVYNLFFYPETPPFTIKLADSNVEIPARGVSWSGSEEDTDNTERRMAENPFTVVPPSSKAMITEYEISQEDKFSVLYWETNQYVGKHRAYTTEIADLRGNSFTFPNKKGGYYYVITCLCNDNYSSFAFKVEVK